MYDTYQIKGDNMELVKITQNIDFITLRNLRVRHNVDDIECMLHKFMEQVNKGNSGCIITKQRSRK